MWLPAPWECEPPPLLLPLSDDFLSLDELDDDDFVEEEEPDESEELDDPESPESEDFLPLEDVPFRELEPEP